MDYNTALVEIARLNKSSDMFGILIGFVLLLITILVVLSIFESRKTQKYRKYLADLYVSGVINKFAEEDSIDLEIEEQLFKRWNKRNNSISRDLDNTIEENLKEKISENNEEKINKKK